MPCDLYNATIQTRIRLESELRAARESIDSLVKTVRSLNDERIKLRDFIFRLQKEISELRENAIRSPMEQKEQRDETVAPATTECKIENS